MAKKLFGQLLREHTLYPSNVQRNCPWLLDNTTVLIEFDLARGAAALPLAGLPATPITKDHDHLLLLPGMAMKIPVYKCIDG